MNCIEREIRAMQLDRQWADSVRRFSQTIKSYPEYLFFSTGENLQYGAEQLGAVLWRDAARTMAESLRDGLSPELFDERCMHAIYGCTNLDFIRGALQDKYQELHAKFFIENDAIFAYRLSPRLNTKMIVFERISDLELIEYALRRNQPATWDGVSGELFTHYKSPDAGELQQHSNPNLTSDIWWGGTSR